MASPGGHINASEYDKFGNQVRELSARNRALALGGSGEATAELTALGISGLAAAERAQLLSDLSIYDDEGTRLVEQLGPVHRIGLEKPVMRAGVTLAAAGTEVVARSRTVNEYDAGRPTDGTAVLKNQVTKVTIGAQLREHPELLVETRVSTTEFDWVKGNPTGTTQDLIRRRGGRQFRRRHHRCRARPQCLRCASCCFTSSRDSRRACWRSGVPSSAASTGPLASATALATAVPTLLACASLVLASVNRPIISRTDMQIPLVLASALEAWSVTERASLSDADCGRPILEWRRSSGRSSAPSTSRAGGAADRRL